MSQSATGWMAAATQTVNSQPVQVFMGFVDNEKI